MSNYNKSPELPCTLLNNASYSQLDPLSRQFADRLRVLGITVLREPHSRQTMKLVLAHPSGVLIDNNPVQVFVPKGFGVGESLRALGDYIQAMDGGMLRVGDRPKALAVHPGTMSSSVRYTLDTLAYRKATIRSGVDDVTPETWKLVNQGFLTYEKGLLRCTAKGRDLAEGARITLGGIPKPASPDI